MEANLLTRIERLERENRCMKRGLLACSLLIGMFVTIGATTAPQVSDVVRTRKLEIVDESGDVCGRFESDIKRHTVLEILNSNKKAGVELSVSVDSPRIRLADKESKSLGVLAEYGLGGGGGLACFDAKGNIRGLLIGGSSPSLSLYGKADELTAQLGLTDSNGNPLLIMASPLGGKIRTLLTVNGDEACGLSLCDTKGNAAVVITQGPDGGNIALRDDKQAKLWTAP